MKADDIRTKMEALSRTIRDADENVRAGKMVDLSGLDQNVSVLCEKTMDLPPAQARDVQPVMASLIGDLERLSQALKDFKNKAKS